MKETETYRPREKIIVGILLGITISATLLGVFAQDIAYFFEESFFPPQTLLIVTIVSIVLFFGVFIVETILLAINKVKPTIYIRIMFVNVVVGFFVSVWSLFVLVMWWH